MADQPHEPGTMDVSDQNATYNGVMKFTGQWGAPFSIGLAVFFTALLVNAGILGGIVAFILSFIATRWVLMTFFAH